MLFLCTGNAARSIMAEAVLERLGAGRFKRHSAGSRSSGRVQPLALALLRAEGNPASDLHSKSRDQFALDGAPGFEVVITIGDNAAAEPCPVWPGARRRLHWSPDDPAGAGSEAQKRRVFARVLPEIEGRVRDFVATPQDRDRG